MSGKSGSSHETSGNSGSCTMEISKMKLYGIFFSFMSTFMITLNVYNGDVLGIPENLNSCCGIACPSFQMQSMIADTKAALANSQPSISGAI